MSVGNGSLKRAAQTKESDTAKAAAKPAAKPAESTKNTVRTSVMVPAPECERVISHLVCDLPTYLL